jgi:DMSO/TMAO reductase YedYZ molybdopterin-dependent catalytic subunit
MTMGPKTPSMFRPRNGVDQTPLQENKALLRAVGRRGLLKGGLSLGALSMLSGCTVSDASAVQSVLRSMSSWNDRVQAFLFDQNRLAPTFSVEDVVKPPRFNAFYGPEDIKPVNGENWRLELAGSIKDKRSLALRDIYAMPEAEIIIRHICIEGWEYIGQWSGVPLRYFLEKIEADLTAKYVEFRCADGYWGSIDMPTALHPQTLLATKYAREIVPDPFGYPLRLRTATKLGFKNPKWITSIEVTNEYRGGYWEDKGFNWFSGI